MKKNIFETKMKKMLDGTWCTCLLLFYCFKINFYVFIFTFFTFLYFCEFALVYSSGLSPRNFKYVLSSWWFFGTYGVYCRIFKNQLSKRVKKLTEVDLHNFCFCVCVPSIESCLHLGINLITIWNYWNCKTTPYTI